MIRLARPRRPSEPSLIAATFGGMAIDVATLIQSIATIVALLGVIASLWIARRGQKQDLRLATQEAVRAERAERAGAASAQRAENAAALTIDTLTRMAEALESLAAQPRGGQGVLPTAAPRRPSWSLRSAGADRFVLKNTGGAVAYDVQLTSSDTLQHMGAWPSAAVLRPGQVIEFGAGRTRETTDSTVTVEWSARPDSSDRDRWRYPLPS